MNDGKLNNILSAEGLKRKYDSMPQTIKALFWFTVCSILIRGISFITIPIFTRILPSDEYGILSVYTSYEGIVLLFATFDVQLGGYQRGIFKYKENPRLFLSSTIALANLLTIIFFGIVFIFRNKIIEFTGYTSACLMILFLYMIFYPAYECWLSDKRKIYDYKPAIVASILYTVMSVAVSIIAVFTIRHTAEVKYCAGLIGMVCVVAVFYFTSFRFHTLFSDWKKVREYWYFLLRYQGPLIPHGLSYLVMSQADRVMIANMVGESPAAYYSVAYNLASVITILQTSLNQVFTPWRYDKMNKQQYGRIKASTNMILVFAGIIVVMFVLVAPEIMKLLLRPDYYESVWCVPPVAIGMFFMFLYTVFGNIESYFEKTEYVTYISIFCGAINILLNYFGIKMFGYVAAAYATLITYIILTIMHYLTMQWLSHKYLGKVGIVSKTFTLLICIATTSISLLITALYHFFIIRYLIFCVGIFALFMFRKRIVKIVKENLLDEDDRNLIRLF